MLIRLAMRYAGKGFACSLLCLLITGTGLAQTCAPGDSIKPTIYLHTGKPSAGVTGPSSTQTPYLTPAVSGVKLTSILSVNDVVGGYRMAGLPDGLGAFDNGDGTFTMLVNHEIPNTLGIVRAHGSKGAFVSKWIIRKSDLSVVSGADLMQQLHLWDTATSSYYTGTLALSRFCSADLPAVSAYYNSATGLGTTERIFMNGEESGFEGKGMAHIVTGSEAGHSYELPYIGKMAFENALASPYSGDKTVVAGTDDGTGGQVYMYVGNKTNSGNTITKAGLTGGKLYGIKVVGLPTELNTGVPAVGTRFEMSDMGFVQNMTGEALNTASVTAGVTTFQRPEDGAWDPAHPNDFYFATTNAISSPTRLWRLRFDNILTPEAGGTIEAVLDGTEGGKMFDNITIDKKGHVLLVEDVGNNVHIGRTWQYNTYNDSLFVIARHDSTRFLVGGANYLTQDEEASGILDMTDILGAGYSLVDDQAHFAPAANTTEVVEGGQLLAVFNPYQLQPGTAKDTVRALVDSGAVAVIDLGIPAVGDNCGIASITNNAPATFSVGTTIVTWTVTDINGNVAMANQVVIVSVKPNVLPVVQITSPASNSSYDAGSTITVQAAASDSDGSIAKVEFYNGATKIGEDGAAPYEFTAAGVEANTYKVTAKAFDNKGAFKVSDTVTVNVTACTGAGYIVGQGYVNIPGQYISNLTANPKYPDSPNVVAQLSSLEYGPNMGDLYGARVRGYVCAPVSGLYTFYIASDDQSELWLSTDANAANKRKIAFLNSPVGYRDYQAYYTQKSVPIFLIKGAKYYIETLHKENTGADHLSVSWVLPTGTTEAPIPGNRLSPFETAAATITSRIGANFTADMKDAQSGAEMVNGLVLKATPNPTTGYFSLITRSSNSETLTVTLTDIMGRIIEKKTNIAANGTLSLGSKLRAGIYFVEVVQGMQKQKLKLIKQ